MTPGMIARPRVAVHLAGWCVVGGSVLAAVAWVVFGR